MSTGIDIVKISRLEKFPIEKFAGKILSEAELALPQAKNIQSLAASFAAKEAFSKALGTGVRGFDLKDVSVMRDSLGKPFFVFSPKLRAKLDAMGIISADVSLTHEKEYALAVVNLEYEPRRKVYEAVIDKFDNTSPDNAITPQLVRDMLPRRKADAHKGTCGRCFVVAGSTGLTGAAIMACNACIRCGAGLVTLGCPGSLNGIFEVALTEVMTLPLADVGGVVSSEDISKVIEFAKKSDCVLLGPGLTPSESVGDMLKTLISECNKTLIIDADGINVLSKNIDILREHKADIILTPHLGEFARLTGKTIGDIAADTQACAREFSKEYNVTTVLKSHRTVVALSDGTVYVNMLGNPGMATGGSGDVLAGVITSFAGQGAVGADAALSGVYIHSLAGDMGAYDKGEHGLIPTDIIEHLPYAVKFSI